MPLTFVLSKPTCEFIRVRLYVHMTQWLGAHPFSYIKDFVSPLKKEKVGPIFLNKEDFILNHGKLC